MKNPYQNMTYEELMNIQTQIRKGKDCRQYHRVLVKREKEKGTPFMIHGMLCRGMLVGDRFPLLPVYFCAGAVVATILAVLAVW